MKRIFLFLTLIVLLCGIFAYFAVPWNSVLEKRIYAFLNSRGVENISFTIDAVGLNKATLSNITVGKEDPLLLQSITVQYQPKELINGNLKDIVLTGLDVNILQTDEGWKIAGLDSIRTEGSGNNFSTGLSDLTELLPFSMVDIRDSHLRITGKSVQTALPFNMHLSKTPSASLEMTINASNLTAASSEISLGVFTIKAQPDEEKNWKGVWSLESLDLGESMPIPVLQGSGTLTNAGDTIAIEGLLANDDKTYTGSFLTSMDLKDGADNKVTIRSVAFPFKGGIVSAKNTVIPFDRTKNITVTADVQKVSLNELMQTLTGDRVSATGTVSGRVPLILKPDGSYALGKGTLQADSDGTIQMPGDIIPGDNEQTQIVREILENLQYSVFSAAVVPSGPKGLTVQLSLQGRNPDVYSGRLVKLNINLTGDVLDFIQQNAMLITNPEKLLKQGIQ